MYQTKWPERFQHNHRSLLLMGSSPLHLNLTRHFSNQTPLVSLLTRLESSVNPSELTQIHGHIVRTNKSSSTSPFQWNCLMRSYLRNGFSLKSLYLYAQMARSGLFPDSYTLPIALKATCQLYFLQLGRQFHSLAIKVGLESDEYCESGIINVYAKTGEFGDAHKLFDGNPVRKLGSWNSMISGLSQGGKCDEAIGLFLELRRCGLRPDDVTMVSVLSACASLGDLSLTLQLHKCVLQADDRGMKDTLLMMNSLVDAYGKCGRTELAYRVFSRMADRNVSSWTAMIMGLAAHGKEHEALDFFHRMTSEGIRPNHVTFVSLLTACAHGGLVNEGMDCFNMMVNEYQIQPTVAHYGCMVDLLGRAGRVEEAKTMVERMPMKANAVILGTLLGACEKHGSVNVGRWAASKLIELEPWNDGVYVVLSNIYADANMWEEVEQVRALMKEMEVDKGPAYSQATVLT